MAKYNNSNLAAAKAEKNDEFYTRIEDIENELKFYKQHFRDKVVYCNCDDPEWSNFFIYFRNNFTHLGLKKLISTHYSIDVAKDKAYKLECVECALGDDGLPVTRKINLSGDGDFRSPECIQLLKESDIVCTNPPFSLFRDFVSLMVEHRKKFLVIGNSNAVTYKETFKLIMSGDLWLGNTKVKKFRMPNGNFKEFGNICWFTNLLHAKRNEEVILWKDYSPSDYPKYDGYNIINVNEVDKIPRNYDGLMGVPITFIEKHNPDQFEILGIANSARYIGEKCYTIINGNKIYNRIIVKRK